MTLPTVQFARGQVLVLTALMMVVLIGITGLAIDISSAYLKEREERAIADAAALAGGQDLQVPGSRQLPGADQYAAAKDHAMDVLVDQLEADSKPTAAPCFTSTGCALPGTPYEISIQTPVAAGGCVDCDVRRAVQVRIRQPSFGLTFARIFGFSDWTVSSSSVAGMVVARQYGIVTLRPPDPVKNHDNNEEDLSIAGGSKVTVGNADVATNTNLVCPGSNSELQMNLAGGFDIYYFDTYTAWTEASKVCMNPPPGVHITTPVDVPDDYIALPGRTGLTTYTDKNLTDAQDPDPDHCLEQQAQVPDYYWTLKSKLPAFRVNDASNVTAICYMPGIYTETLKVSTTEKGAVLLEPGVYFFDAGLEVSSTFIGGYVPEQPGVVLVFPEANNLASGQFVTKTGNSVVALNFGDAYCPRAAGTVCSHTGTWAHAAQTASGPVETSDGTLVSLIVTRDEACVVGDQDPPACDENHNATLKLDGGGSIFLAGVQFAPSDNAKLAGNAGQTAEIGAFWAWTIQFTGGTQFSMQSSNRELLGVLRLDPACSPTVTVCNP
jgi:hypothetical protein